MIIRLLAVGQKMPEWITSGFNEYARRFPPECKLQLTEIATGKRGKNADIERLKAKEADAIESLISQSDHVVALEVGGKSWSTNQLAKQLEQWQSMGKNVALLVGGPEGLSSSLSAKAHQKWSLSSLTLPHPLVRVVVAEALYRAWSQTVNHPYHRQ